MLPRLRQNPSGRMPLGIARSRGDDEALSSECPPRCPNQSERLGQQRESGEVAYPKATKRDGRSRHPLPLLGGFNIEVWRRMRHLLQRNGRIWHLLLPRLVKRTVTDHSAVVYMLC